MWLLFSIMIVFHLKQIQIRLNIYGVEMTTILRLLFCWWGRGFVMKLWQHSMHSPITLYHYIFTTYQYLCISSHTHLVVNSHGVSWSGHVLQNYSMDWPLPFIMLWNLAKLSATHSLTAWTHIAKSTPPCFYKNILKKGRDTNYLVS